MANCEIDQPTCINCNAPIILPIKHCPTYKKQALTLQIVTQKAIPYLSAALEENAAQSHQTITLHETVQYLHSQNTQPTQSNPPPHKTPSSKHHRSRSYQRELSRLSQLSSKSSDKRLVWPLLSSRNESEALSEINSLINDKLDEKPNKLTPYMPFFYYTLMQFSL